MKVMVLDPKGTHENNPDCPSRLVQAPDWYGKTGWMCIDCGFHIIQKLITVRPEHSPPADIPKLVVEIEKVASEVTFRAVYEGSVLATYKTWDNVIMAGGNPRALLSLFMKDVCQTLWTSFNIYALEEQVWNKVAEAVDRMAKAAHYPDGEELNR